MTKARDLANIISGGFTVADLPTLTASEIPNLDASKITTGSIADARIPASAVSQHATSFDDNAIVNDLSTLALRQASDGNRSSYNTNSQFVDVFQDSSGVGTTTNTTVNSSEFVSSIGNVLGTNVTAYRYFRFNYTTDASSDYPKVYEIFFYPNANAGGSEFSKSGASASQQVGGQYGSSNGLNTMLDGNTSTVAWFDTTQNHTYTIDFGSGVTHTVKSLKFHWQQHEKVNNIKIYGSNDNSSFSLLADDNGDGVNDYFTLQGGSGGLSKVFEFDNATVLQSNATGNFISNAITASASTNKMGAIITYQDNAGTNTLNTDIVLQLSADGGSNFTTATMTAMPDFATGIKMAKVNDLTIPNAGTSLKYKISFANQASGSKEARIRGVSLQY